MIRALMLLLVGPAFAAGTPTVVQPAVIKPAVAASNLTFDGCYSITNDGLHVGASLHRAELDPVHRTRILRYFIITSDRDKKLRLMKGVLKTGADYAPVTSDIDLITQNVLVRAVTQFTGRTYRFSLITQGKTDAETLDRQENMVFSLTALQVLMLKHPAAGQAYHFRGIPEDLGRAHEGQLKILESQKIGTHQIFEVMNDFEMNPLVSIVSDTGEVLKTEAPERRVVSELTPDLKLAIGSLGVTNAEIVKFFGVLPTCRNNLVANKQVLLSQLRFGKLPLKYYKRQPKAIPLAK